MKGKYLAYISAGLIAFITPLAPALWFVGLLVMCDFLTGIAKAKKRGQISSARMIDKFYASVGYFLGIIVSHTVELYFGDAVPIVKAVVAIIALSELQSLRENIEAITGTDIMKPLYKFLKERSGEKDN